MFSNVDTGAGKITTESSIPRDPYSRARERIAPPRDCGGQQGVSFARLDCVQFQSAEKLELAQPENGRHTTLSSARERSADAYGIPGRARRLSDDCRKSQGEGACAKLKFLGSLGPLKANDRPLVPQMFKFRHG